MFLTYIMFVGFTFASKIFGRICPWAFCRGFKNQCLERFVLPFSIVSILYLLIFHMILLLC